MVFNVQLAPTNAIITVLIAYLCIETIILAAVACDDFGALVPEWSETTSVICSYTALLPSGLPQRIPRYLALYTESSHNLEQLAMESWEGSATALLCEIISRTVWRFILSMLQRCSGGRKILQVRGAE